MRKVLQRLDNLQLWLAKNDEIGGISKTKKIFDWLGILLVVQRLNKLQLWLAKNEEIGGIWKTRKLFDRLIILLVVQRLNKLQFWLAKNEERRDLKNWKTIWPSGDTFSGWEIEQTTIGGGQKWRNRKDFFLILLVVQRLNKLQFWLAKNEERRDLKN